MKSFLVLTLLLSSLSALAQVGANFDAAELKLRIVYSNRDSFLKPCVATPSPCGLSAGEMSIVNDVLAKSPFFFDISFLSAKANPTTFKKDANGQYPLYDSQGSLSSPIRVNSDRLVEAPFKPVASFDAFVESIFTYLFFQQSKSLPSSQALAKKYSLFWGKLFKSSGVLSFKEDRVELLIYRYNQVRIMLLDSKQAHILNPDILKNLNCEEAQMMPTDIINFSKLEWTQFAPTTSGAKGTIQSIISFQCATPQKQVQNYSADISIETEFQFSADKKHLNMTTVLVKVNGSRKGVARR